MASVKQVEDSVKACRNYAVQLRNMANQESDNNTKKLLMEAAHHLDVGAAELDYIITSATVAI